MNLILEAEAGQLHTDQVGDGADPDSFFRLDGIGGGNLREVPGPDLPVGNHRIYFRQEKKGIVRILHVRHAARDEGKLFS